MKDLQEIPHKFCSSPTQRFKKNRNYKKTGIFIQKGVAEMSWTYNAESKLGETNTHMTY